jgi:hypothetical protein
LREFILFDGFSIRELLNYLLDWGRLCVPDQGNINRARWQDTEFWSELRTFVTQWADGIYWPTSRLGKEFHPISEAYIKFLSGTIAGGIARFGGEEPNILHLIAGLATFGETQEKIIKKAAAKAAIISRL